MNNYYIQRISNPNITSLKQDEVFVFGSNHAGRHGKGAAKQAMQFGAKTGQGEGPQGKTYGIPTKSSDLKVLKLSSIKRCIDDFTVYAKTTPDKKFLVTAIGCGLAGYTPREIAPLFKAASTLENVYLPKEFWEVL